MSQERPARITQISPDEMNAEQREIRDANLFGSTKRSAIAVIRTPDFAGHPKGRVMQGAAWPPRSCTDLERIDLYDKAVASQGERGRIELIGLIGHCCLMSKPEQKQIATSERGFVRGGRHVSGPYASGIAHGAHHSRILGVAIEEDRPEAIRALGLLPVAHIGILLAKRSLATRADDLDPVVNHDAATFEEPP